MFDTPFEPTAGWLGAMLTAVRHGESVRLTAWLDVLGHTTSLLKRDGCRALVRADGDAIVIGCLRGHVDVVQLLATAVADDTLHIVFLGDYSDAGPRSCEAVVMAAACVACLGTRRVSMLRGRHEHQFPCPQHWSGTTARFDEELRMRCVQDVACGDVEREVDLMKRAERTLRSLYDALPLGVVIGEATLCVCGGPSAQAPRLADIEAVSLASPSPTDADVISDLVGSEPADEDDDALLLAAGITHGRRHTRTVGSVFSFAAACRFLELNGLRSIVRAHPMPYVQEASEGTLAGRASAGRTAPFDPGYKFHRRSPVSGMPTSITLSSAPYFGGIARNFGAVLMIRPSGISVHQFSALPMRLPQLPFDSARNAFQWSMPLVSNHLMKAVAAMLDDGSDSDDDEVRGKLLRFRRLCIHEKRSRGTLDHLRNSVRGADH